MAISQVNEIQMSIRNYYNNLDGYRFIAVSLVIVTHWLPSYFDKYPFSKLGVDMFFVLSGFLITEILLKNRQQNSKSKQKGIFHLYKSFYIRRGLRIFPIYYLIIFLFILLGSEIVTCNKPYFIGYLVNFLIIKEKIWIEMFSHLWSLAVEEQFYILWPLIILSIPNRLSSSVILFLIFLSFFFILFSQYTGSTFFAINTLSCISTLCTGAFLAYSKINNSKVYQNTNYDSSIIVVTILAIFYQSFFVTMPYWTLHLLFMMFAFFLIKFLVTCEINIINYMFSNHVISYLGKISYGLYLYHSFIPWFIRNLNGTEKKLIFLNTSVIPVITNGWSILFINTLFLITISSISWFVLEIPINNLKKYFNYAGSK